MTMKTLEGKLVTLNSALGLIDRLVAREHGDVLEICTQAEWEISIRERRQPQTVGFFRRDVVKVLDRRQKPKHNVQYGERTERREAGADRPGAG